MVSAQKWHAVIQYISLLISKEKKIQVARLLLPVETSSHILLHNNNNNNNQQQQQQQCNLKPATKNAERASRGPASD